MSKNITMNVMVNNENSLTYHHDLKSYYIVTLYLQKPHFYMALQYLLIENTFTLHLKVVILTVWLIKVCSKEMVMISLNLPVFIECLI